MTFKGRETCIFPVPSAKHHSFPAQDPLLGRSWTTGLRHSKSCFTYQNKRNRNQSGWVVGSGEGAVERFGWKYESGHYNTYGIIIVYIVSSLPNNHVKSPAQCWHWRGHEQQDSNSITVAWCPQSEVLVWEGSHSLSRCYSSCSLQCTLRYDPLMQLSQVPWRKGSFSLSC